MVMNKGRFYLKPTVNNIMAHGFHNPFRICPFMLKNKTATIFLLPIIKAVTKSIKTIQYDFCWLLAELISQSAQRGLLACTGFGD